VSDKIRVPIYSPDGKEVGGMDIDPASFGGEVNKQLLHDAVVMYQANRRAGTHKTKTRAEVAGSGKKLFRQKGTGNARVGTRRTNKRRGGGTAFGPTPRDYSYSMPKQQRRLATMMALLSKFQDAEAVVVDGLSFDRPKTKQMNGVLKALKLDGQSCLVATNGAESDKNLYLSARNIQRVEVAPVRELNAYLLLKNKRLVLTKPAIEAILAGESEAKQPVAAAQTGS
jgi:large subunit ribosomal protein L4